MFQHDQPTYTCSIFHSLSGLVWKEMRALYDDGLFEYLNDLWNILDYISNVFYITWIFLRFTAFYVVSVNLFSPICTEF